MITKEELKKFVGGHSWYQTIQFEEDVKAKGCRWCGEPAWENIVKFLPESLEGMRVLDLGCNAGLFCVKASLMGAKEVIGIDWKGWRPNNNYIEQAAFVKEYFEQKHNKKLNIKYISGKMEEVLLERDLGEFDYVFAIASIYYTKKREVLVEKISKISENVIVRLRDTGPISKFTKLFIKHGFIKKHELRAKWWEKLNIQTDDFYMYHYTKQKD